MSEKTAAITADQVKLLLTELGQRPIAFQRSYVRVGGSINAALMLSQAMHWARTDVAIRRGGWFYKTSREWEAETGLTRREQETARKKLKERGLLEEELRGIPAKLYYRVNLDRLAELLLAVETKIEEKSSMAEECTPAPISETDAQFRHEHDPKCQTITKSTTKNTTEITYREERYNSLSEQSPSDFSDGNIFNPEDEQLCIRKNDSLDEIIEKAVSSDTRGKAVSCSMPAPARSVRQGGLILTDKANDRVCPVYEFWLKALGRFKQDNPLKDEARWIIAARLNDGFSEEELMLAVLGCITSTDIRDFYIIRDELDEPREYKDHPKRTALKHIFAFSDRVQKFIDNAKGLDCNLSDVEDEYYSPLDYGVMSLEFEIDSFSTDDGEFYFDLNDTPESYYMIDGDDGMRTLAYSPQTGASFGMAA